MSKIFTVGHNYKVGLRRFGLADSHVVLNATFETTLREEVQKYGIDADTRKAGIFLAAVSYMQSKHFRSKIVQLVALAVAEIAYAEIKGIYKGNVLSLVHKTYPAISSADLIALYESVDYIQTIANTYMMARASEYAIAGAAT